jgi:UDP-xylose/UDP-N-acetylglucosamine transporter B4
MTASRRRQTLLKSQQQNGLVSSSSGTGTGGGVNPGINGASLTDRAGAAQPTRVINAAPSLEKAEMYGIDDNRPVFSRVMALAGRMFIETIPQWLAVGAMLSLIFGGCCSNVFALEAIVKVEPASGRFLSSPVFDLRQCRDRELLLGHWVLLLGSALTLLERNTDDIRAIPLRHHHKPAFAV